jgi:hypothetical protein
VGIALVSLKYVTQGVFGARSTLETVGAWELSFPALTCPSILAGHPDSATQACKYQGGWRERLRAAGTQGEQ